MKLYDINLNEVKDENNAVFISFIDDSGTQIFGKVEIEKD